VSSSVNITGSLFPLLGISATSSTPTSSGEIVAPTLDLAEGTVLRGIANGRSPQGATIIRTEVGDLFVQTDIFIKRGIEVAVQVERRADDAFTRLVSIDGKSVPKYLEQLAAQSANADDSVLTSNLGAAARPSAPASSAILPGDIVPARVEAVLLTKPAPLPPAPVNMPAAPAAAAPATAPASAALTTPASAAPTPPAPPLALPLQEAMGPAVIGSRLQLDILGVTFPSAASGAASPATLPPLPQPSTGTATPQPSSPSPVPTATASSPGMVSAPTGVALPTTGATSAPPVPPAPSPLMQGLAAYQQRMGPQTPLPASSPTTGAPPMPTATPPSASPQPLTTAAPPIPTATTPSASPPLASEAAPRAPLPVPNDPADSALLPSVVAAKTRSFLAPPSPTPASPPTEAIMRPAAPPTPVFSAMVIGQTGPDELILQTPVGTLKLLNTPALPPGTQLQARLTQVLAPDITDDITASAPASAACRTFPAMEALAALASQWPPQTGGAAIPAANRQALSDILFLLSALKGGDVKRWLGDARVKEIESKAGDLLARLGAEFTALRGASVEAREPQGWNALTFPFLAGQHVEPVRLYYKRQSREGKRNQAGGEHFLVDFVLSSFGRFQLDGLVKRAATLQFDLVVRSEQALEPAMEQEIRRIYHQAAETGGFQGNLTFRHGTKACVPPPVGGDAPAGAPHSIVV